MSKDLIKWSVLSEKLTGSKYIIRENNIPKQYEKQVKQLLKLVDKWDKLQKV